MKFLLIDSIYVLRVTYCVYVTGNLMWHYLCIVLCKNNAPMTLINLNTVITINVNRMPVSKHIHVLYTYAHKHTYDHIYLHKNIHMHIEIYFHLR